MRAAIFDTFAQHHPEYVSLAWGAMKFLFISVLNHEELLSEISKAISNLADVLPRTELHSILYPTARMQEAVSLLYAKIMEFVVKAIKWCKKGKARHAIAAIAHPFELKFKNIIDEITRRSRGVDELANAAAKAEIRDLHFTVHQMHTSIAHLTEMMACKLGCTTRRFIQASWDRERLNNVWNSPTAATDITQPVTIESPSRATTNASKRPD